MSVQEAFWAVVFLVWDRGRDERSCGLLAGLVVVLGVVAMALLARVVLTGWAR